MVLSNLFAIFPAQLVRRAFDLLATQLSTYQQLSDSPQKTALYEGFVAALFQYGLLIVGMALVRGLFLFFMRQSIIVMSRHIEFDQKNDIYAHYQKLPIRFFRQNNTGDLMARISEDVSRVRMYTGPAIMYGLNLLTLFVLVISYMVSINAEFTLYVLLPLPFLSVSIYFINNEIEKRSDQIQKSLSNLSTFVQEAFSGIRVIKAFGRERESVAGFARESDDYRQRSIQLGHINSWFSPLILTLIGASSILTVFIGGQQVMAGKISLGNIAEFLIYVNMLTWPVTALGWVISIAQRAAVSQGRINEFLNEKTEIVSEKSLDTPIRGDIRFENVSLVYPDSGIEALSQVSFEVKEGQSLGILGTTGSGKSSLANLICRLYDATEGTIFIDNIPIKDFDPRSLRRQMSYVPQDVFLFSDSIRKNIQFGKPDLSHEEVEEAARQADLLESILGFEKQFETVIGERGITLSGGQKQRLSIARALAVKPRVLVLDDCLSAVDTKTENVILSHLEQEMKGKTTIVISHRISTVKLADRIMVIDAGKVLESGSHESLLALGGFYKELYDQQLSEDSQTISKEGVL